MSRKIIGITVGTQLPKPNFKQTDPTMGDYIRNKPDFDGLKTKVDNVTTDVEELLIKVGDTSVAEQIADKIEDLNLPTIESGHGEDSMIIVEGNAIGQASIAGGTTDESLVKDVAGIDINTLTDELIIDALGERGVRLKNILESNPAPTSDGAASIAYGTGNHSITAMSTTFGVGTEAGSKGFYLHKITVPDDGSDITISLTTAQKPYYTYSVLGSKVERNKTATWNNTSAKQALASWSVGDKINIILKKPYCLCESIVSVDSEKGIITVTNTGGITKQNVEDATVFDSLITAEGSMLKLVPYQFSVAVPAKPEIGTTELHFAGIATGLGSIAAGTLSQAHGLMNLAAGQYSFVVGKQNETGYGSFACGEGTKALGNNAHAEGYQTTASGNNSHAEGHSTVASSYRAHAEGYMSRATAVQSHAEGHNTEASGNVSHAEGYESVASGRYSHAEGQNTKATGLASHTEGFDTIASGESSHAEGGNTVAAGEYSHVQGKYNIKDVENKYAHIVGNGTSDTKRSNAHTLDWSGNAWFAGDIHIKDNEKIATENFVTNEISKIPATDLSDYAKISDIPDVGGLATEEFVQQSYVTAGRKVDTAVGIRTTAEGFNTESSGTYSHAEGYSTIASGAYSHAEGHTTVASGSKSHAEGYGTQSTGYQTHAEGVNTIASGNAAHAEGNRTIASGAASHAEGYQTIASGSYSHAEGDSTVASADYAHAEGHHTEASGFASHAEGYYTTASGSYSHAEGYETEASGTKAHAEGYYTSAIKEYSHAEGYYTTASSTSSHAEGYLTTASGYCSHAEGIETIASGSRSHAEGYKTQSIGYQTHAQGVNTIAKGNAAHAEGNRTIALGATSHVQGKYNIADVKRDDDGNMLDASGNIVTDITKATSNNEYAYIVGNGTSEENRSNAHTLDWSGNAWFAGNLSIDGNMILNVNQYGDTLPKTGIKGQIFFLKKQ